MATTLAAVDLGASSGRVIVGSFEGGRVTITETGRFANGPVSVQERTVRFLKNTMGLWILNECVRAWKDGASKHRWRNSSPSQTPLTAPPGTPRRGAFLG